MPTEPNPGPTQEEVKPSGKEEYFSISPFLLRPSSQGRFSIFLRQGENLVLYTYRGETFTQKHRERLLEMGVRKVFVRDSERRNFDSYILNHLGEILEDEAIGRSERAQAWYDCTTKVVQSIWEWKLPQSSDQKALKNVEKVVSQSVRFILEPENLNYLARFLRQGFKMYHHSLSTMVYSIAVAGGLVDMDDEALTPMGLGAILHDLGKGGMDGILDKKRKDYEEEDWNAYRSHPARGVAMCSGIPLNQISLNCILFHHEQEDGKGFPTGMSGKDLPLYVKVVSLCNAYDNLTRATAEGPAKNPFQALKSLKAYKERYNEPLLCKLITVLANANLT